MRFLLALGSVACVTPRPAQDPTSWFDPGVDYDVQEPVAFTDVPYDFTGDVPIADLPEPEPFFTWFGASDAPAVVGCADWDVDPTGTLPAEITGIVTILPRFYFKTSGCTGDPSADSDEKYYGSYFIEDASGGFFVLGDSKVAHFDMGDRVTLKVRAIKESFEQFMISTHDVVEVERGPEPISYQRVTGPLGAEHMSRVVRVQGVVTTPASTFGEIYFEGGGVGYKLALDQELGRRGVTYPVGTTIEVTGPVLFSNFPGETVPYEVIVMRVGQIETLAEP